MKKYCYQKFLLNCDYEEIALNSVLKYNGDVELLLDYGEEYSLFDLGGKTVRKIKLNDLDSMIDTEDDWADFLESLEEVDELVIYSRMKPIRNPVVAAYREATLKAYISRLEESAVKTRILLGASAMG